MHQHTVESKEINENRWPATRQDTDQTNQTSKVFSTREKVLDFATSIVIIGLCIGIFVWFEVHSNVFHPSISNTMLYLSVLSSVMFVGMGVFLTYFIESKYGPEYGKSHEKYIQAGAVSLCVAFVSSIVTLWPVYQYWTILLSLTAITLMVRVITLIPARSHVEYVS